MPELWEFRSTRTAVRLLQVPSHSLSHPLAPEQLSTCRRADFRRLPTRSDVPGGILGYSHDLATRRRIDDDVSLRADCAAGFGVNNHVSLNTLLGAARDPLGKVGGARFRVVEFNRELRIQLRCKH